MARLDVKTCKWRDVLSIVNGKNQKEVESPNGAFPIYGSGGIIGHATDFLCPENTVVLGRKGSINKPIFITEKFWNVDTAFGLVADEKKIIPRFLYYFCVFFDFEKLNTTVTIPSLTKANLLDIVISLPDLAVQKKIVNQLLKIDKLISLREAQLSKLDQLVKSRFIEMFGDMGINTHKWPEFSLQEVCRSSDDIKCGPFGTQLGKSEYQREGVPLWGIPQINSFFTKSPTEFLSKKKAQELEAYSLTAGDIAMSRKGNVGMCALYPENFPDGVIHSDVLRIRVNKEKVHPLFILMQLHHSPRIKTQVNVVSSGAIMAGINVTKLKNINAYIPPLPLQEEFAAFVQKVDESKAVVKQSLEKLETLKKSLMQEYFG